MIRKNTLRKSNTKKVMELGAEVSSQLGPQLGFSHVALLVDCWVEETDAGQPKKAGTCSVVSQGTGQLLRQQPSSQSQAWTQE